MPCGIILKGIGGFYYVETGKTIFECKARGIFRKDEIVPLPGDSVEYSILDSVKRKGSLDVIHSRTTQLVRPAVANVNQVLAVIAAKNPDPDLMLLDKLLITAEKKDINAIVCINKIDLDTSKEHLALLDAYNKAGYEVIKVSSKTNEGYNELKTALAGKITVLAGQSGVGKSTMLNNIMNMLIMEIGDLSEKTDRGKHTTRHAELIMLKDGGYIADTPGFSSFELAEIEYEELQHYFPEFYSDEQCCRFTGCSHICEPDCVVRNKVATGEIDRGRYDRYLELYSLLKQNDAFKYKNNDKKRK